jgi:hypothetical protein
MLHHNSLAHGGVERWCFMCAKQLCYQEKVTPACLLSLLQQALLPHFDQCCKVYTND